MKSKSKRTRLITLSHFTLLFFLSCVGLGNESVAQNSSEKPFVSDPQPVDEREISRMNIGEPLPSFRLPAVDGSWKTAEDFKEAEILVIAFICNHCPTAQAYEDRLIRFTEDYSDKGVQVVAVSPNSTMGLLLEECGYSDLNDSYEEMKLRAAHKGYNFPYLYDGDDHAFSMQLGPAATPEVFVFDRERKLQYAGRLDGSEKPGSAHAEDLRAATDALLDGKTPEVSETKAFGCSVKWAWKSDWAQQVNAEWKSRPVNLQELDLEETAELVANPSDKLLLINVWATWCAPCVIEYPHFVDTQRMYGARDFEFVSISMDRAEHADKALAFLEKTNSALRNYIYSGEDKYAFIEALDPDWSGALPYTLLIEPGGKVVWSYQGPVDFLELRRTIVDHPMIGRYY